MAYYLIFDIGTKNLAYSLCKIDKTKKIVSERFNMLKCDVINICGETICCCENKIGSKKKGVMCKESAVNYKFKEQVNDDGDVKNLLGLCKKHLAINKNSQNPIITYKISSNPIFNNDFNTRFERLITNLVDLFDLIENYYKIKNLIVRIENQPSFLTPQMKTVSVIIFTYFMTIFSNDCKKTSLTIANNLPLTIANNSPLTTILPLTTTNTNLPLITTANLPLTTILPSTNQSNQKLSTIKSVNFISPSIKTSSKFVIKLKNTYNYSSKIKTFDIYDNRKTFSKDIAKQFFDDLATKNKHIGNFIGYAKFNTLEKCDDLADTILYLLYASIYD